jgi:hypothetical protein
MKEVRLLHADREKYFFEVIEQGIDTTNNARRAQGNCLLP